MNATATHIGGHAAKSLADLLADARHDHHQVGNRRGEERFPYAITIRLGRIDEHGEFKTIADLCSTDLSRTGMGLLSKSKLPVGNVFWLEMKSGKPDVWRIQARIVYCRPLFADVFRLGAVFLTS